jgi:hypothetical protein
MRIKALGMPIINHSSTKLIAPEMNAIKKFFLDMLPVVLGVLLALLINNLNESIREQRKIQKIRTQIIAEIADNYNACKEFVEEQEVRNTFFSEYRDSLDVFSERGYCFRQLPYRGLRTLSISHTAWDAAQYSGVLSSIDFEGLQGFTAIYQRQQFLLDFHKQMVSNIYSQYMYDPALMKSTFYHMQQLNEDYMAFARSLLLNYEYYLKEFVMMQ